MRGRLRIGRFQIRRTRRIRRKCRADRHSGELRRDYFRSSIAWRARSKAWASSSGRSRINFWPMGQEFLDVVRSSFQSTAWTSEGQLAGDAVRWIADKPLASSGWLSSSILAPTPLPRPASDRTCLRLEELFCAKGVHDLEELLRFPQNWDLGRRSREARARPTQNPSCSSRRVLSAASFLTRELAAEDRPTAESPVLESLARGLFPGSPRESSMLHFHPPHDLWLWAKIGFKSSMGNGGAEYDLPLIRDQGLNRRGGLRCAAWYKR